MSWMADIRYALRGFNKNRAHTAVALLTLALSAGANTAIFSMADAIVNRPFAFPELNRVVSVSTAIPRSSAERYAVSPADYFDWLAGNRVFSHLAAYEPWGATLTDPQAPRQLRAYLVSPGFFSLTGIPPLRGRAFDDSGWQERREQVVLSFGFWQQYLASDPDAVGKHIDVNGLHYTIAGIMPRQFDFPAGAEMWAPWVITPEQARSQRAAGTLGVIGRLKPSVALRQARAQMAAIAADLARKYPATNAARGLSVMLLSDVADPYAVRYMTVISVAVAFLLLLACANVANLQLVRFAARRREWAIRASIGAGRPRLARQLLVEGVLLSLAGVCLAAPLALYALQLIKNSIPELVLRHLPGLPYARIDSAILLWLALGGVVTGIAFTVPAVLQVSTTRPYEMLSDGARGSLGPGGRKMRSALVVCEIAFALILLAGAALLFRGFHALTPQSQGFDPANVLTFNLRAPAPQRTAAQVAAFFDERLRHLRELNEAASVALVSELPALADSRSGSVLIEGQPPPPPETPLLSELRIASADYFRTMSIPIVAGRAIARQDAADALQVAVISKAAARLFFPRQDPIGGRIRLTVSGSPSAWFTVVGVAADVNHFFLDTEIRPTVYVPYAQHPVRDLHVVVKTSAGVDQATAAIRRLMRGLDPAQPAYSLDRLDRFYADLSGGVGVIATLIGIFALLSLLLAAGGLYAVMHYSVQQRTREIGIRMAMGARSVDVLRMVLRDSLRLLAVALAIALPAALALTHVMSSLLAGIVALDPVWLAGAAMLLAATALLASYVPARRAARVDPLNAIRDR